MIELLVVLLIIGILAAIALPAFLGQRDKSKDANAKSDARNLVSLVESCFTQSDRYTNCTTAPELSDTGLPLSAGLPASGSGEVGVTASGDGYTIVAASKTGNDFSVLKDPTDGTISRTCSATGSSKGGCRNEVW